MALKRKTPPLVTAIDLTFAKACCRVLHADEDTFLTGLIEAAVSWLDGPTGIMGRALIEQTWELYLDAFPSSALELPFGSLIAVETVEYIPPAGSAYSVWPASGNYIVDAVPVEGWVIPVAAWPATNATPNAVRVTFRAGYGPAPANVESAVKLAAGMLVAHWYRNRETVIVGVVSEELALSVKALVAPFRRGELAR